MQEKNITYPTDNKLYRKIIKNCVSIAEEQHLELRQSYRRTIKKLAEQQRFGNHSKNHKRERKADKKIKTIAGRLVRELERKLPADMHADNLILFKKVLQQKHSDTGKIYSPAFEQQQRLTGNVLKRAFMDRGYRGISQVRGTKIEIPRPFNKSLNGFVICIVGHECIYFCTCSICRIPCWSPPPPFY